MRSVRILILKIDVFDSKKYDIIDILEAHLTRVGNIPPVLMEAIQWRVLEGYEVRVSEVK